MTFSDTPVQLRLKPQRHFPFLARHPWVHAHSLADEGANLDCGQVVDVLDHDGNWIARGLVNPASRLRVRLYGFDPSTEINPDWFRGTIDAALARRRLTGPANPEGAERLLFSESDLMSGLIVDRYADCLAVQFTAAGLMRWRDPLLEHLQQASQCQSIMVRVDAKTAKYEGIEAVGGWHGPAKSEPVIYTENGLQLEVDLEHGQKTGGYLDQRCNHLAAAAYLKDRSVLDVCCYHGGFGLVAAAGGARSVTGIDSSEAAIEAARRSASRNGISQVEYRVADCFDELKRLATLDARFDAVILDPPRFAGSRHQVDAALRAYWRLNAAAVDILPPGGVLVTCSCSGRVSRSDFLNMLLDVGRRRRRDLIMLESRGPAPDHPVSIACPESNYLKCIIAQVR